MCERFFTQTTRLRDLYGNLPDAFSEMQLIDSAVLPAELSLQEFHSFALKHDMVWMSEGAFITANFPSQYIFRNGGTYEFYLNACFSDMTFCVFAASYWLARVPSDFLVGLFARSNMPVCKLHGMSQGLSRRRLLPVSGEALTELLMQGNCRKLALYSLNLNEPHFHALRRATSSLKLSLDTCNVMVGLEYSAVTAFVECLQNLSCSLHMTWDSVNTGILALALSGASQLQKLTLNKPEDAPPTGSLFHSLDASTALVESLQANIGLVELKVSTEFDDFDFPTLCRSLRSHTTLTSLTVFIPFGSGFPPVRVLSEENKTVLLEGVHGLLKTNTVLHTIKLPWCLIGTPIYEEEMVPRLEKNRFRRHFLAVKTAPGELRIKLLCAVLPLLSTTLIFEVFRDSVDVLLPMLLADGIESVLVGAQNNKVDLKARLLNWWSRLR
jgi:hypothetical protein